MPSVAASIAAAVKAELAGQTFSPPITCERKYAPHWDLRDIDGVQVTVVPRGNELASESRAQLSNQVSVDVAVQKKVSAATPAELDPLMNLVQDVTDFLTRRPLAGFALASWLRITNTPIYAPEHLADKRLFTSVLTVTYVVQR
jgi:H2-forming N5,N10-methylenetetrahydromethanopterin dehydrogenase-like enzyme